ncbi:hypothetical protein AB6Q56_22170 [Dechloromonas sp. ARDL1]|uniref:hypothetical protein n=1 Tax=Dechloromonas sp. ARDL1 TaxID=3322121 RepID=UPI003DA6E5C2
MNDSNSENIPENPPENQPAVTPQIDSRRRLRELLSVPERDRTDEQWDEIIELEIQLAPGNRISGSEQHGGGTQGRGNAQHGKQGAGGGGGQQQKKHRPRSNNNRRPRQNKPQSGGGGSNPA